MAAFCEIGRVPQTLLLSIIFLLNLCQYGYLILLFHYGDRMRGCLNALLTLLVFISLPLLRSSLNDPGILCGQLPAAGIGLICLLLLAYTFRGIRQQIHKGRQILTPQSVKEAVDKFTGGLVYFSENGLIVLCNTKMQELFSQMTGHDLQLLEELEAVLGLPQRAEKQPAVRELTDGSVWQFARAEVTIEPRRRYIQYIATDVTRLYRIRENIARDNEKMQVMIQQVHGITNNMAEITRQEEILAAKMRVHNKMGNCMLGIRQYLMSDLPHRPEEKMQLIRLWEENLKELQNEVGACDTPDALDMVVRIAEELGLEVVLHGTMPAQQKTAYLLVTALRECVTNALNHADAGRLDMTITMTGGDVIASFTNDGTVPQTEIREGGGLSSLRSRIEASGGTMKVISRPVFMLQVTVPLAEDEFMA